MKLQVLTLMATFTLSVFSFAQTRVESTINAVTVYRSGAQIERSAQVRIPTGRQVVIFNKMPINIEQSTVKVKLPNGVRLMKMEYRYATPDEQGFPEFRALGVKIADLEKRMDEAKDIKISLEEDLSFIAANSRLGEDITAERLRAADTYISTRRRQIRTELREVITRIEAMNEEAQKLQSEFAIMEVQLNERSSVLEVEVENTLVNSVKYELEYFTSQAKWVPFYNVRSTGEGGTIDFEMMGSIQQNSGEPWENVMLKLSTGNPSLGVNEPELPAWVLNYQNNYVPTVPYTIQPPTIQRRGSFIGVVLNNHTGEPMSNARVELVSGNTRHIAVSDEDGKVVIHNLPIQSFSLNCQYVGFNTLSTSVVISTEPFFQRLKLSNNGSSAMVSYQPAVRMRNDDVRNLSAASNIQFVEGVRVNADYSYSMDAETEEITRLASRDINGFGNKVVRSYFNRVQQAISEVYEIDKPFTVKSNGDPQEVHISTSTTQAEYIYRMRPARSEYAYLITRIPNWEELNLIEGKANFFVQGTYNGSAVLSPDVTVDTLELALGTDQDIVIDRERVDASKSQRFLSSKIDETFHYHITVRNTKRSAINIIVQEQHPISGEEDIKVSEIQTGDAEVDRQSGVITWERELPASTSAEFDFSFMVTYKQGTGVNLPR